MLGQPLVQGLTESFCKGSAIKYLDFTDHIQSLSHILRLTVFLGVFFLQSFKNVKALLSSCGHAETGHRLHFARGAEFDSQYSSFMGNVMQGHRSIETLPCSQQF